jgi:hypothetical protein
MRVHTLPVVAIASSSLNDRTLMAAPPLVIGMSGGNNWQQIACLVPCWLN